jgi:NAD(P)-dependent dehydrogenase (short-subunit alcohol dehydrogenase family)
LTAPAGARELDTRTVVVSGGSSGIGLAIAEACAREGATLVVVARGSGPLADSLARLRSLSGKDHRSFRMDVGRLQEVQDFAGWLEREGVAPDALVNCAGSLGAIGKTTSVDMLEFSETIQTNLLGTVYMCRSLAPLFAGGPRPKIVNCSGGGGTFPFPNYSAYAVSKAAVVRFTENLALELAEDGVDVNCIAPGFVATRLHERTMAAGPERAGAFFQQTREKIAAGAVPAEKSAELTVFLLSRAADGISGKYVSAPWDPWRSPEFQRRLRSDKDFGTLRRIDDQQFFSRADGP